MLLSFLLVGSTLASPAAEPAPAPELEPAPLPAPSVPRARVRLGTSGGVERVALGLGSAAAMGVGSWWMLSLGESLGAGDVAAVLFGAGAAGLLGVTAGAGTSLFDPGAEALLDPANTPRAFLGLAPAASPYLGEKAPWAAYGGLAPRAQLGRWRITPMFRGALDLGSTVEVDPLSGGTSSLRQEGLGGGVEVRGAIGPEASPWFDLVWRPTAERRYDHVTYVDGTEADYRRSLAAPLTVGGRWYLTGRQRFEVVAGPRFDQIRWSAGREDVGWSRGPLYLEAFYSVDIAHGGAWSGSRFQVGYLHSKVDGAGLDIGAVNGIFGPAIVRYDLRWRPQPTAWALQLGLDLTIADGGGGALQLGVVPPRKEAP